MNTGLVITHILVTVLFIVAIGIRPLKPRYSKFELNRRAKLVDRQALKDLERYNHYLSIKSLQSVVIGTLLIVSLVIAFQAYGFVPGLILQFALVIFSGSISSSWPFRNISQLSYKKIEEPLLRFSQKYVRTLRYIKKTGNDSELAIGSSEDLSHLVQKSADSIGENESKLIVSSLAFGSKKVKDIMTKKSEIVYLKKSDVLGPIVLNDLHNSGHKLFPVISRDIDTVVGILDASKLLVINGDSKASSSVESIMDRQVITINKNESLESALAKMQDNNSQILLVKNDSEATVGLITLGDITLELFGRQIEE